MLPEKIQKLYPKTFFYGKFWEPYENLFNFSEQFKIARSRFKDRNHRAKDQNLRKKTLKREIEIKADKNFKQKKD